MDCMCSNVILCERWVFVVHFWGRRWKVLNRTKIYGVYDRKKDGTLKKGAVEKRQTILSSDGDSSQEEIQVMRHLVRCHNLCVSMGSKDQFKEAFSSLMEDVIGAVFSG